MVINTTPLKFSKRKKVRVEKKKIMKARDTTKL